MFHLYGFFIGVAIVVGYSIAEHIEPKVKEGAGWVISAGLVGARIYHVLEYQSYYSLNPSQIWQIWNGGLSIWGAMIGGMIALFIYHYTIKTLHHLASILGAIATAMPLAQAIGRIGNGVNHEFINLVWILPWWGAEMTLDLILFVLLWRTPLKYRMVTYLVGYGLIRYILQPFR
ncbi:MAG: prolipoprotein diacylglyceryl transferase family protein [Microgenomates group bacterium]